jgi:NAD(P)-dependent dehydrogenase (short-subunit alcohol dehydrogenase family)
LDTLYKVNIGVAAEINRLNVPGMVEKRYGRLVHVGSIASQEATASVGYNTVKSALAAYVRSLGRELAESSVVASGILPGAFYAPENSWERLKATKPEVVKEFIEKNLPRELMKIDIREIQRKVMNNTQFGFDVVGDFIGDIGQEPNLFENPSLRL